MNRRLMNFINYFRLIKLLNKATIHRAWYKIIENIIDFATQVQQNGKPMLTKIACIDMSEEQVIGPFDVVSLWAGVGDANPIERGKHLKAQNSALKELLGKCRDSLDSEIDKDLILNIALVLDTFE